MKGRFKANPFEDLALTPRDANNLLDIVNTIVHTGFERYENFWTVEKAKVNTDKWKLIKSKENSHIFLEQQSRPRKQIRSDIRASMASRKMSVYSDLSTVTSDEPPTEEPPRFSYGFVIF
ncbi:hypothetical protein PI124_g7914 [Phytophthora idaei]|nr:hypothetical protein PI124_g7914 [Phytophthora idaei]